MRFGPFSAAGCERNAREQHEQDLADGREPPRFGISVSGDYIAEDESVDDVVARICATVPLNGKTVATVSADTLVGLGWTVNVDIPPPLHYLIGQGDMTTLPDVDSLALVWSQNRTRNPAWTGK